MGTILQRLERPAGYRISILASSSLRLQNTEQLNHANLIAYARKMGVPFVIKAVDLLIKILEEE